MTDKKKRGIIQSRGLGDIIIALPIARYYYEQGETIVWPVCEEFYSSVKNHVPWVEWVCITADERGDFFLKTPLYELQQRGVGLENCLYLYQYLNAAPQLTDPQLFSVCKFDQYKYAIAGVPFLHKWQLANCITRNLEREAELKAQLNLTDRYCVAHLTGSSARVDPNLVKSIIDPAVQIINVDDYLTDSIFDWIGVLEGAESVVCLDSAVANLVDQLEITGPELYWIRRSGWDLTPVLGSNWRYVRTNLSTADPQRVDPQAEAAKFLQAQQVAEQHQARVKSQGAGQLQSHVPFDADRSKIPKNFMHALRK